MLPNAAPTLSQVGCASLMIGSRPERTGSTRWMLSPSTTAGMPKR